LPDQRIAVRKVISITGEQPETSVLAANHQPKPIMLDFVNPARPAWRFVGTGRKARDNKIAAGYRDTRTDGHAGEIAVRGGLVQHGYIQPLLLDRAHLRVKALAGM
jgi:hypothetical protein